MSTLIIGLILLIFSAVLIFVLAALSGLLGMIIAYPIGAVVIALIIFLVYIFTHKGDDS